jgi:hypothetical protein
MGRERSWHELTMCSRLSSFPILLSRYFSMLLYFVPTVESQAIAFILNIAPEVREA